MPIPTVLDMETTDTVCPPDVALFEQLVNISQKVLDTLLNSNIVEKGKSNDHWQFWNTYRKVAEERDNEYFERHDSDMEIILIFSGLFSAVNTAFITTMGPRDSTTTNALLTQIITLMVLESNGTSIGDAFPLPVPPAYSSGQVWYQALAYASLSFSLLAAFGAVLGRQWLHFYKHERFGREIGGGIPGLEDCGKNRQKKLEGMEVWHFDAVLQIFPVLLQLSLLLFAVSLSSYTWTQQQSIAALVIATTVLGCLFCALTLFASLLSPSCPFQTSTFFIMAGAFVRSGGTFVTNDIHSPTFTVRFRSFFRSVRVSISRLKQQFLNPKPITDMHTMESAVQWLLASSTEPDDIVAVAALIPTITWQPDSDIALYCQRLLDTFVGCFETNVRLQPSVEDRAMKCGRALNHLCLAGMPTEANSRTTRQPKIWHTWRSIILPREFNLCKTLVCKQPTLSGRDKQICQANARTALRMMIAAACDGFIHPDSDAIIWRGRFKWSEDRRTVTDFDWLVDYLASDSCSKDGTAKGDAILALSAMGGLGSRNRASAYLKALISALNSDSDCLRVRYAALRAVSESRTALADINAIEDDEIRSLLLEQLSPALLTLILIDNEVHIKNYWRDDAYLRLIVTLTSNEQWCQRLVADQHIERCIFMLKHLDVGSPAPFHLAVIFRRVFATCPVAAVFKEVKDTQFPSLAKLAWQSVLDLKLYDEDECTNALPDVINFTRQNTIATADLKIVRGNVRIVVDKLKRRNKHPGIILAMENYLTS